MNRSIASFLRDDRGNILVVTLLVLFAVSVLGASVAMMSSMDLKISGNQRQTTMALHSAEAGLTEAIHRLGVPNPTVETVGAWTGNIAIGDARPYDPNWTARIYMTAPNAAPAAAASEFHTGTVQDLSSDHVEYSRASGTEGVLTIRHKWEDRNGDGLRDPDEVVLYDVSQIPPENFDSGFPVEIITVTGRTGLASRGILAEVTRRSLLARTLGALYTDKAIQVTGSPAFCGFNHDVNIPDETLPNACFGWHLGDSDLPGITTTGDNVDVKGKASDIIGDPTPTDTSSTNPFYNLEETLGITSQELNQILASPDNTTVVNPLKGVTYITGDATINSNIVGEGLLYVTGNLKSTGDFQYKGLIYVEGDVKMTGNPWILGSLIVRGSSDYNFSAGNAGVLYSRDAILNYVGQSFPMVLLSWREM